MSRTARAQQNRNANRAATSRLIRTIAHQVRRLSDADVYALTYSADRQTRRMALQEAHMRAERYASREEK